MQILINHLTRMQPGLICTAGIDLETRRHIRPVAGQPLTRSLLSDFDGLLELGRVIDLGPTVFCGQVPEIEDRRFFPEQACVVKPACPIRLWEHSAVVAADKLRSIFGPDLEWYNHSPHYPGTAVVAEHSGIRSLGCYWAQQAELKIVERNEGKKVRLTFIEDDLRFSVAVTDIRCYQADHNTPDEPAIIELSQRIAGQARTLVSIGLSRASRYSADQSMRHWLQVNNIHTPP
jgi:hypothetical protein